MIIEKCKYCGYKLYIDSKCFKTGTIEIYKKCYQCGYEENQIKVHKNNKINNNLEGEEFYE